MGMISLHDVAGAHRAFFTIPATGGAAADGDFIIFQAPFLCKIRDVVIAFDDAITGQAATFKLQVYNRGTDGLGVTALTVATGLTNGFIGGVNVVAFEAYALYDPTTYLSVASGIVLSVHRSKIAGGGLDMPRIHGFVDYEGR